jgi:hypothetical protein
MNSRSWKTNQKVDLMIRHLFRLKVAPRKLHLIAAAFIRQIHYKSVELEWAQAIHAVESWADQLMVKRDVTRFHTRFRSQQEEPSWNTRRNSLSEVEFDWPRYHIVNALLHLTSLNCDKVDDISRLIISASEPNRQQDVSKMQIEIVHDVVGNPFRPVAFDPAWQTTTAISLAQTMYDARDFAAMPVLADALEDAGCAVPDVLNHCRDPKGAHVRGCWVVDLVLGKT